MIATQKKKRKEHPRARCYRLLGIAQNQLKQVRPGFTEEDYRHILFMNGATLKDGKYSATTMSIEQMLSAIAHCQELGFKSSTKVQREGGLKGYKVSDWRAKRIGKLNALWCHLADMEVINDRSEQAMRNYCMNNVPGLTRFEWITSDQLNTAIEMLKKMSNQRGVHVSKTSR